MPVTGHLDTAHVYASYARQYYLAAEATDDALGEAEGYELIPPPPVMFLLSHSIELSFKSFLALKGVPECDLRRLSHDLKKSWDVASSYGGLTILSSEETQTLCLLSRLHKKHLFRYSGWGGELVPVGGPAFQLADKLSNAISQTLRNNFD